MRVGNAELRLIESTPVPGILNVMRLLPTPEAVSAFSMAWRSEPLPVSPMLMTWSFSVAPLLMATEPLPSVPVTRSVPEVTAVPPP